MSAALDGQYTPTQRIDAIRIAHRRGPKHASEQTGIPREIIRKWMRLQERGTPAPTSRRDVGIISGGAPQHVAYSTPAILDLDGYPERPDPSKGPDYEDWAEQESRACRSDAGYVREAAIRAMEDQNAGLLVSCVKFYEVLTKNAMTFAGIATAVDQLTDEQRDSRIRDIVVDLAARKAQKEATG